MILINHKKLHQSVLVKIRKMNISQRELSKKCNFSRSSIHRLNQGKPIKLELFFKLIDWLEEDANNYLLKHYVNTNGIKKEYEMNQYLKINSTLNEYE